MLQKISWGSVLVRAEEHLQQQEPAADQPQNYCVKNLIITEERCPWTSLTEMLMHVVLWLQPPCSQSQPRLCPFNHNFSPQYECPVTKPAKFNLAWLKPIHATGWAGTGGVLRNQRNPFTAHTAPAAKNVHLHPEATKMGEIQTAQTWGTAMGLWAGTWRAWQMKGAMIDGVVATVTAKAEKETKETGYGCLRRLICYIPESFYEFLLTC